MELRRLPGSLSYCCVLICVWLTHVEAAPYVVEDGYEISTVAYVMAPAGIAMDSHGNLFIGPGGLSSQGRYRLQKVTPCGVVTDFGPLMRDPDPVLIDEFDNVYVGTNRWGIQVVAPDETSWQLVRHDLYPYEGVLQLRLINIEGLAWDPQGNIIAASFEGSIARITRWGEVTILTVLDFPPAGVACTPSGEILICTRGLGKVIVYDPTTRAFSVLAEGLEVAWGVAIEPVSGDVFISDIGNWSTYGDGRLFKVTTNGKLSVFATGFDDPAAMFFDGKGNLFVTDIAAQTVTKITGFPIAGLVELKAKICPRVLNPSSKGNFVTCVIYYPKVTDGPPPVTIDFKRPVLLNGTVPAITDEKYGFAPPLDSWDDDKDEKNKARFMVKFCRRAVLAVLPPVGEVPIEITGWLSNGTRFRALASVRVNPQGRGR